MLTLLAVSGGIDSMTMADMAVKGIILGGSEFGIAHCNFRLRGEESDGDQELVRKWAGERGVRFHSVSFDTEGFAAENHVSVEMAARELRYRWFAQLCAEFGYDAVAVAHNANDNAETMILNLLRGTGIDGVCGMAAEGMLPVGDCGIPLLRPLLGHSRKKIEGYAFANHVPYRTDHTNLENEVRRNVVRNLVFPIFEQINPSFVKTLNREAAHFSQLRDIVREIVPPEAEQPLPMKLSVSGLLSQPHWKYRLYRLAEPYGVPSAVLESLENLIESERTFAGKSFDAGEIIIETSRDAITFREKSRDLCESTEETVNGDGDFEINGIVFRFETLVRRELGSLKQPEGVFVFDASALSYPLHLRGWKEGDWMVPLGMRGRRKLSDIFSDLHLDERAKRSAVVIGHPSGGSRVAAVPGIRQDDSTKITEDTERILRISIIR
ncbi:MAG: tRNA lysidine(34) synthetase TilS [Bacteroidales bacterium]|nr:tRNA lysidine(34) synthetase TilS [Bacteroidales bacterium]